MDNEKIINTGKDKNKQVMLLDSTLSPVFFYIILYYIGLESSNNGLGHNSVIWVYGLHLDYCH